MPVEPGGQVQAYVPGAFWQVPGPQARVPAPSGAHSLVSAQAVVPVSATRRTGVDELWNIIRAAAFDRQTEARD